MKIYAISVVKNEVDIIDYSLQNATKWADKVIVFDNGSTDGTWEKIKSLRDPKIIPFKKDNRPYSDGLRAEVFNTFKDELNDGDWWVIQDSDEIYDDNPRDFINQQRGYYHHINGKKVDFCFDLNKIDTLDFKNEFADNVKYFDHYTPEAWSEPRAIKHRKGLVWEEKKIWPTSMGIVCSQTINIKHFPLRSANQIKARWATRQEVRKKGGQHFDHWQKEDWKEYYAEKLKKQRKLIDNENVFDHVPFANNYKQPLLKTLAKFLLHKFGVLH